MNKYEEAIERAKDWIADPSCSEKEESLLKSIFPELREKSKDEEIRDFLVYKFKELGNIWPEYSKEDILDWLERQKPDDWKEKDLEKELDTYIEDNFTIDKEQLERFGVSPENYIYSIGKDDILKMVRYFTSWQKKKSSQLTEALQKANKMIGDLIEENYNRIDEDKLNKIIQTAKHHCYLNQEDIEWLESLKIENSTQESIREDELDNEIRDWFEHGGITDTRYNDYSDSDIKNTARHFYKFGKRCLRNETSSNETKQHLRDISENPNY